MSATTIANFSVAYEVPAAVASDAGDTGVVDVGDGTGLSAGDGSELSSGTPACPSVSLEILPRVAADAAGTVESAAQMFLDPPTLTESSVRQISDGISPGENLAAPALGAGWWNPIEALAVERADSALRIEQLVASRADGGAPIAAASGWSLDPIFAIEYGRLQNSDFPVAVQQLAAFRQDYSAALEILSAVPSNAFSPQETTAASALTADAVSPTRTRTS
jgi:hypothetical protein